MVIGLLLIAWGIMILIYPQILAYLIAGFFIMMGVGILTARWFLRRAAQGRGSAMTQWFIRY